MKRVLLYALIVFAPAYSHAQILGGGTEFNNAVLFNQAWLTGCPSTATTFSNQKAFEPTDAIDPCAPTPTCATGTTGADIWFAFIAQSNTATIVVNPTAGFDVAIQAFGGDDCPGLAEIGCVDVHGNNQTETLYMNSLTANKTYYFRVFGATNSNGNRTGLYNFCGSSNLGSAVLPVDITRFTATAANNKVTLLWTTATESLNDHFVVEKALTAAHSQTWVLFSGTGTSNHNVDYSLVDPAPFGSITYYRLKQVDVNGTFKYSAIVPVRLNKKLAAAVSVSPNPIVDKINLNVQTEVATEAAIRILNNSGALVFQTNKALVKGTNVFTISTLTNLAKGLYTVQVMAEGKQLSTRFVVN